MITEFTVNHSRPIFKTSTVCSQCNSICTTNKDTLLFRYHKQCIENKKAKKQCTFKNQPKSACFMKVRDLRWTLTLN